MKTRPQIQIDIPHKLVLSQDRKLSCLLLAVSQLLLGANLISVYVQVLPIFFLGLAIALLLVEKLRKKDLTSEAIRFCRNRIILHILAIFVVVALQATLFFENNPIRLWNLLIFILLPLSIYDAFALADGKLGMTFANLKLARKMKNK